mgnify:FL=1
MEDILIEILSSFGYPVCRQGSFNEDDKYPDSFFTFWNTYSPDHAHYDDKDYLAEWEYDVNFYSVDPELTYSVLADARILLKQNMWIVPSRGYDLYSDRESHTGRGMQAIFLGN